MTRDVTTTLMEESNCSYIHKLLNRITKLSPSHKHCVRRMDGKQQELLNAKLTSRCGDTTPRTKQTS